MLYGWIHKPNASVIMREVHVTILLRSILVQKKSHLFPKVALTNFKSLKLQDGSKSGVWFLSTL